jgi:hypothetical protein
VALELAEDGGRGEGGEGGAAAGVEAVDRVDQAEAGDLEQIVERLAGTAVAQGEAFGERQVTANQLFTGGVVAVFREPLPEQPLAGEAVAELGRAFVVCADPTGGVR